MTATLTDVEKYVRHVLMLKTPLPIDDLKAIGVAYETIIGLERDHEIMKKYIRRVEATESSHYRRDIDREDIERILKD